MTCDTFIPPPATREAPGIAVWLGRALENWGRPAARPRDRERLRLEYQRQRDERSRSLEMMRDRLRW
jgi:hypothetical protein